MAVVAETPPIIIQTELKETPTTRHVEEAVVESEEQEEEEAGDEDDDEYDEIQAVVITVNGIKYLHDTTSNIVYTMEEEETGKWNGSEIEFIDK